MNARDAIDGVTGERACNFAEYVLIPRLGPGGPHPSSAIWRPALSADLKTISRIADAVHPHLPESPAMFAEKLQLFPEGCFVLALDGSVVGYGISYPWMLDQIPLLDTSLEVLPASPTCLFVHDAAIVPEARGYGFAVELMRLLSDVARQHHLPALALVSVYGSDALWSRCGFGVATSSRLLEKLASYGPTARYMTAAISP